MSTKVAELYVELGMKIDKFNKGMTDAQKSMQKVGKNFTKVGKQLSMRVTLPLVALGAAALKVGADFEQSLTNAFVVTGSSSKKVKQDMENLARSMGKDTVFSAKEAADAMYFMASAGWKADDMSKALKHTLDLAAATQSDLAFVTDTVVASLSQFQMGSEGAERLANVFAAAISNSQATMTKLGTSMTYVGPIFNSLGKSVEEATSVLMGLFNAGYGASQAGTALRMAIAKLLKPTKETKEALNRLGLSMDDVNPVTMKFADIIDILGKRGASTKDIIEIFGVRAGPAMAALIAKGGDALKKYEKDITGTNAASKMADEQIKTFKGSLKLMTSALVEAGIMISKALTPVIKFLVDSAIIPLIKLFQAMPGGIKIVGIAFAALAAIVGPLLIVFGQLSLALSRVSMIMPGLTKRIGSLKKAMLGLRAASLLTAAGIGIVIIAAYKAYEITKKLIDAKNKETEATWTAVEAEQRANKTLREVADAAGITRGAMMRLVEKYKGSSAAVLMAIKHGKEEKKLQEALTVITEKRSASIEKETKSAKKLIPTIKETGEETKTLAENLSLVLRVELEKKLADMEQALVKYKGQLTVAEEQKLREEIMKLGQELAKTADETTRASTLFGGIFAANTFKAMQNLSKFKDAGEAVKWRLAEIAQAAGTTALAIKVAAYNMWTDMLAFSGIYAPKITANFLDEQGKIITGTETTTTEVKSLWSQLADGIQTKMASTWSDMLQGTTSFKDGVKGVFDSIKQNFFDMIGTMIAKWTVDFIGNLLSSSASAGSKITSTLGDSIIKMGETATKVGKGIGAAIVSLAKGIAGAAKIIAGAAKEILIAAAVALTIAAGFGVLKKLLGTGGGKAMDATNRELHNIWIEARNSWQELMIIRDKMLTIAEVFWGLLLGKVDQTNALLEGIKDIQNPAIIDYLKIIANALTSKGTIYVDIMKADPINQAIEKLKENTAEAVKGIASIMTPALVRAPAPAMMPMLRPKGGERPDIALPFKYRKPKGLDIAEPFGFKPPRKKPTGPGIAHEFLGEDFKPPGDKDGDGDKKLKKVVFNIRTVNRFEIDTLDPRGMRRVVRQDIIPLILDALDANFRKSKWKARLGI